MVGGFLPITLDRGVTQLTETETGEEEEEEKKKRNMGCCMFERGGRPSKGMVLVLALHVQHAGSGVSRMM